MLRESAATFIGIGMILVWTTFGVGQDQSGDRAPESRSEEFIAPRKAMSIDDVVNMALARNPTLRQAAAAVDQSTGQARQATRMPNPQAGFFMEEVGNENEWGLIGLFVSQEFVPRIKRELAANVHRSEAAARDWQGHLQRWKVVNSTRLAYFDLLTATQRERLAEQAVTVNQRAVDYSQELVSIGEAPERLVRQARLQLGRATLQLRTARLQTKAAERALAAMVGVPEIDLVPVMPPESRSRPDGTIRPQPEIETVWQMLQSQSPELHAANARVQKARWNLQSAQAQTRPNIRGQFGVGRDSAADDVFANLQVGVTVPVRNRFEGQQQAAMAGLIQATAEVDRIRLSLRRQLVEVFRQYETAREQFVTYEEDLIPNAVDNLASIEADFRNGNAEYLELLTAQRTMLQFRGEVISVMQLRNRSRVLLEGYLATGGLDAPDSAAE